MKKPSITIYLIGFAGVGKFTIAKELSKNGYKIIDNHLINNPILSLLELDGITPIKESAWTAIREIRSVILDFISHDRKSNFIFTNELLEENHDHAIYNQIKKTTEERGSLFIPVKLIITREDEHKKRIQNPQRRERLKECHWPIERLEKGLIDISHQNLMTLDVTDLSPMQAAEQIIIFVGSLYN